MFKFLFESKTCPRCGGSGHYSYCQMYGTVCFKCSGRGGILTKRGAAAQNFLNDLRSVEAKDLKVGDLILEESFFSGKAKWAKIESIELVPDYSKSKKLVDGEWIEESHSALKIVSSGMQQYVFPNSKMRKGFSAAEKAEQKAKALAYQASLGKNGLPLKKAA
jgi:hypothetical protein